MLVGLNLGLDMFVSNTKGEKKLNSTFQIKSNATTIDQTQKKIQQYVFLSCRTVF